MDPQEKNYNPRSYVGKMAELHKGDITMWLRKKKDCKNDEYQRYCVHEFGHALGFWHTHMDKTFFSYLSQTKQQSYINEMNNLVPLNSGFVPVSTGFDEMSVMTYPFDAVDFNDSAPNNFRIQGIKWNIKPSDTDCESLKMMYDMKEICDNFENQFGSIKNFQIIDDLRISIKNAKFDKYKQNVVEAKWRSHKNIEPDQSLGCKIV